MVISHLAARLLARSPACYISPRPSAGFLVERGRDAAWIWREISTGLFMRQLFNWSNVFGAEDRRTLWLRRAVGGFGLALVGSTWRMWTPQDAFPQVPFFGWGIFVPRWCDWVALVFLLAGLTGALFAGSTENGGRHALKLFLVAASVLVLLDQQRFQPWMYEFMLVSTVLLTLEPASALRWLQGFVVGFYFFSAISKFDYSFPHALGQHFLRALADFAHLDYPAEPGPALVGLAFLFPVGELAVACGLWFRRTRAVALGGAVLLHLLLLVILGPWGLNHRPGVLLWNLFFIAQDVLLFAAVGAKLSVSPTTPPAPLTNSTRALFGRGLIVAASTLPLLAPLAWFDTWPAWGLYAGSAQRVTVFVHRGGAERLPAELQPYLEVLDSDEADDAHWAVFHLDRWALDALAAPIYPQNRSQLGVAAAFLARYQLVDRARLVRSGLADRFTGQRKRDVLVGLPQILAAGQDYFFNTRPRRPSQEKTGKETGAPSEVQGVRSDLGV